MKVGPQFLFPVCSSQQCPQLWRLASSAPAPLPESTSPASSVKEFLAKHEISVSDPAAPAPALTFTEAGLSPELLNKLAKEFPAPTPIQAQALPIALAGTNMVWNVCSLRQF